MLKVSNSPNMKIIRVKMDPSPTPTRKISCSEFSKYFSKILSISTRKCQFEPSRHPLLHERFSCQVIFETFVMVPEKHIIQYCGILDVMSSSSLLQVLCWQHCIFDRIATRAVIPIVFNFLIWSATRSVRCLSNSFGEENSKGNTSYMLVIF